MLVTQNNIFCDVYFTLTSLNIMQIVWWCWLLTYCFSHFVFTPCLFWCQLHQHFMSSFCAQILLPKNYKPKLKSLKRCAKNFGMTVNFTNFLQAAFSYKVLCAPFMCLQFEFVIFWRKDFGAKAAHNMLVKLTPGHLFTFLPLLGMVFSFFKIT